MGDLDVSSLIREAGWTPRRIVVLAVLLLLATSRSSHLPPPLTIACDTDRLTSFGSTVVLGSRFMPMGGVSLGTGAFQLGSVDVGDPASIAGRFVRSYLSLDTRTTLLGPGWTSSADVRLRLDGGPNNIIRPNILMTFPDGVTERFNNALSLDRTTGTSRGYRVLTHRPDGTWIVDDNGTTWTFASMGNLTRVDYPGGDWAELRYKGETLESTVGPDGAGLVYTIGADHRFTKIAKATAPTTFVAFEYDPTGRLVRA